MDKAKLQKIQKLRNELNDWLDELYDVNTTPELESIYTTVRDQVGELDSILEENKNEE